MRSRFSGYGPVSNEFEDPAAGPSKSQLKRDMQALQDLGAALTEFGPQQLASLDLPSGLREALDAYRQTRSHEGRRRQMQFIGKLMRQADVQPIREAVEAKRAGRSLDAALQHAAEQWRADLIADDAALQRWASERPQSDLQHIRSLVRAARKDAEIAAERTAANQTVHGSRAARDLFRAVRDALEEVPVRDQPSPPHRPAMP
jgi:ribosome-associated protein